MQSSKNRYETIQYYTSIVVGIGLFYLASYSTAFLIQNPSAQENPFWIISMGTSFLGMLLAFFYAKKIANTPIKKQTYCFVFLILAFSFCIFIFGNVILKYNIPIDVIKLISLFLSAPLSCYLAGFNTKEIVAKFQMFLTNNGTTIVVVIVLSSIPIVQLPLFQFEHVTIKSVGTIALAQPSLFFKTTENTTIVNGYVNGSGFFAEIPIGSNKNFDGQNILKIVLPEGISNDDFQISQLDVSGNFEFFNDFNLYFSSNVEVFEIVAVNDSYVHFSHSKYLPPAENGLSMNLQYNGKNIITTDYSPVMISFLVEFGGDELGEIFIKVVKIE